MYCFYQSLMNKNQIISLLITLMVFLSCGLTQKQAQDLQPVVTGAERTEHYFPALMNKSVALVANHTSVIGNTHLVDTLLASGITVAKVFAPEHGFRGEAEDGTHIEAALTAKRELWWSQFMAKKRNPQPGTWKMLTL